MLIRKDELFLTITSSSTDIVQLDLYALEVESNML